MRRSLTKGAALARSRVPARTFVATPTAGYGRTAAYRRITSNASRSQSTFLSSIQCPSPSTITPLLHSSLSPSAVLSRTTASYIRQFSSQSRLQQQTARSKDDVREDSPTSEQEAKKSASESGAEDEKSSEGKAGEPGKEESKQKEEAPPPPHGDKTPWQVFTETLRNEFKASKEWNESTKQIAAGYQDFTQNPNLKAAQSAFQKSSEVVTGTAGSALKKTASAIGSSAAWTWDTSVVRGIRKGANVVGSGLEKATRPVRETEAFKSVKETIDDGSSSRYGGWSDKDERRRKRELREAKLLAKSGSKRIEPAVEDPNAGTNVTVHKDAAWKEKWREFRDNSPIAQRFFEMKNTYNESENPLISTARSISDRVAGFFAENETAMVIKKFREMDPSFQIEPFLQELREYILPEVLDAYVKGDTETLKLWLSTPQYQVYEALMKQYTTAGLKSDGKILDIRHVDILNARLLENEIPVFIITCRTQEVHVYRDIKTNNLMAGMDDKVQLVTYAIGVTRIPEDVNNPETRGWRLIELQKSARDYI
ncbi:uncharacterized protein PV09_02524 [Verruconis gallopava]|uniref:Mitochondrial import inner membrane translocase subunit TIM44 n=1 Tax=Verruconis gallopava TaxID=253628 RepID=A0A0D2B6H9_9PEZI|nr:uncharacterized protein PV09_02524 [Verruconis gallopava]KIW06844.1 hypothetical protein PV09_02524 [Verruconis gallopava]